MDENLSYKGNQGMELARSGRRGAGAGQRRGEGSRCRVARPESENTYELSGYGWQIDWDPGTFGRNGEWSELSDDDPSPWEVHLWRLVEGSAGPWPPWHWHEWQTQHSFDPPPKPRTPDTPLEYEAHQQVTAQRSKRTLAWLQGENPPHHSDSGSSITPLNTDEDARLGPVWDYHHMDEHWSHDELMHLIHERSPNFDMQSLIDQGVFSIEDPYSNYDYWRLPEISSESVEDFIDRHGMWLDPHEHTIITPPRDSHEIPIDGQTTYWLERNAPEHIEKDADFYIDPNDALESELTAAISPAEFRRQSESVRHKRNVAEQLREGTGIFASPSSLTQSPQESVVVDSHPGEGSYQSADESAQMEAQTPLPNSEFEAHDLNSLAEDTSIDESSFE